MRGLHTNLIQPYHYNKRFRLTSLSKKLRRKTNKKWLKKYEESVELGNFPAEDPLDHIHFSSVPLYQPSGYFSFFGPSFSHSGILHRSDKDGIIGAIRRVTNVRCPERPGYHESLIRNQYENVTHNKFRTLIKTFSDRITNKFQTMPHDLQYYKNMWCDAEHPKRLLRQNTRTNLQNDYSREIIRRGVIEYKEKDLEILEPDKYKRAIADMGPASSTVAGCLIDPIKLTFAEPYAPYGNRLFAKFVKSPELPELEACFDHVWDSARQHDVAFYYFSDDAIFSCKCTNPITGVEELLVSDSDISKSDGSQYDNVFLTLRSTCMHDTRFNQAIYDSFQQLKSTMRVLNPEDRREWIEYEPSGFILYSGSVWTTMINNWANMLIIDEFTRNWYDKNVSIAQNASSYQRAAEHLGFIVKIKQASCREETSFLKHFPAFNGIKYVPILSLGVIFRAIGKTKYDLPGSKKQGIIQRINQFNHQYAQSLEHAGRTSIRKTIEAKFIRSDTIFNRFTHYFTSIVGHSSIYANKYDIKIYSYGEASSDRDIEDDSIAKRYGVQTHLINEVCTFIENSRPGEIIRSRFSDVALKLDYGI